MSDEPRTECAPTSEEEVRAYTVGELVVHGATIHLADYDPSWPGLFEHEAARISSILGDRVRLLEHVGSTAVPGLAAKPIIDMVLAVPDSAEERVYIPDMETSGYLLRIREPSWYEHRLLKGPDTDINLHTFSEGCPEIDRMLEFRNWLRAHNDERELYERTKRELAAREWRYVQHYADAKTEIVKSITERAQSDRSR